MSAPTFFFGMAVGAIFTAIIVTATTEQDGPTGEQIMRMIPIYCGKDGCQ